MPVIYIREAEKGGSCSNSTMWQAPVTWSETRYSAREKVQASVRTFLRGASTINYCYIPNTKRQQKIVLFGDKILISQRDYELDERYAPSRLTFLASQKALRRLWDTPEEDKAWQDL